jgi:hypothetical protein
VDQHVEASAAGRQPHFPNDMSFEDSFSPRRTGRTALTDDDLCLFDALFDCAERAGMLRRDATAACNLPYTHNLDAAELEAALRRLGQKGFVRLRPAKERPDLGPWVELTPAGGVQWELERAPDWNRFCRDSTMPDRDGAWVVRVIAVDEAEGDDFLATAIACKLHAADLTEARRRWVRTALVPWQAPRRVVEWRVPLAAETDDTSPRFVDWETYQARRTWWRSIAELITLR